MAKAYIYLHKAELSKSKEQALKKAIDGKVIEFPLRDQDLDLDGKLVKPVIVQGNLFKNLQKKFSNLSSVPKPSKIESNIDEPGTYKLEVETPNEVLKGKLKLTAPSPGDPSKRTIKSGSKPPHVKLVNKGADLKSSPHPGDLKDLIKQMQKTASYAYSGSAGTCDGWVPSFNQHNAHTDSGTRGYKAYIDQPTNGTGTKWRLYFHMNFDLAKKTLVVTMTDVKQDH